MMTDCVLGIDIGTSGVRIAAIDLAGKVLSFSTSPLSPSEIRDGHATQNPDEWWQAVGTALDQLDHTSLTILALAIDGTSGTILPIDERGQPLRHA